MIRRSLAGEWQVYMGINLYEGDRDKESFHPTQQGDRGQNPLVSQAWASIIRESQNGKKEKIVLPATTEQAGIGRLNTNQPEAHLKRTRPFIGKCLYSKTIEVTQEEANQWTYIELERTKAAKVYIDGHFLSESSSMTGPQKHFIAGGLSRGIHLLEVVVDNELGGPDRHDGIFKDGHQFSDHTQTDWNGILGDMTLVFGQGIKEAALNYDIDSEGLIVIIEYFETLPTGHDYVLEILDTLAPEQVLARFGVGSKACEVDVAKRQIIMNCNLKSLLENGSLRSWDEWTKQCYVIRLLDESGTVQKVWQSGFRVLSVQDKSLLINDKRIFLRGDNDCAVFPMTGAAPMDEASWMKRFELLKTFGLNHLRFHSWCPPEVAFRIADQLGVYLQVELSCFGTFIDEKKRHPKELALLEDTAMAILRTYGHHPSFMIFTLGNELDGDLGVMSRILQRLKDYRPNLWYATGTNNFIGHVQTSDIEDLWIAMRTKAHPLRGAYSHGDLPLGHLQQGQNIGTSYTYNQGVAESNLPIIAHEIGQYQFYPVKGESKAYGQVLHSTALEHWEHTIDGTIIDFYASDYEKAVSALAQICYKEEIEAAMRTKSLAGFQLLSLMDFSGQGTALVGPANALMDVKEGVNAERWRMACSECIVLAVFPKRLWTYEETFEAAIFVRQHKGRVITARDMTLVYRNDSGKILKTLQYDLNQPITTGLHSLIDTSMPFGDLFHGKDSDYGQKISLKVSLRYRMNDGTEAIASNDYDLFVFSEVDCTIGTEAFEEKVTVSRSFDQGLKLAEAGGTVLVLPSESNVLDVPASSNHQCLFTPDFWNFRMFKEICLSQGMPPAPGTMGLYVDANHPVFEYFPSEFHADWQWQRLMNLGIPLEVPESYVDDFNNVVHVIDHFQRSNYLSLLGQLRVGKGSLTYCGIDLIAYKAYPEVACLWKAIEHILLA